MRPSLLGGLLAKEAARSRNNGKRCPMCLALAAMDDQDRAALVGPAEDHEFPANALARALRSPEVVSKYGRPFTMDRRSIAKHRDGTCSGPDGAGR